jgi:hypothetical protein
MVYRPPTHGIPTPYPWHIDPPIHVWYFDTVPMVNAGQLGPRTTRTETSRPVSEDKSARKRGLVGPYVKKTRTVLLFYNIFQYLYVNNY